MAIRAIFFLYFVMITLLSLWPSDSLPDVKLFLYADKLIHAGIYAGFTFLMFWAWPGYFAGVKQLLPLAFVISWGLLMEILQKYSCFGRSFDLTDAIANCIGFLPGWLAWKWFERKRVKAS